MLNSIKSFDAYPKTLDDFKDKWVPGACISMTSMVVIVVIIMGEISMYSTVMQRHSLYVDTEVTGQIDVHLNISFPKVPCVVMNIDMVDSFGDTMIEVRRRSIKKVRLNADGSVHRVEDEKHAEDDEHVKKMKQEGYCGSCYGAEAKKTDCCNSCDSVKEAYEKRGWSFSLFDSIEQCAGERLAKQLAITAHEGCNIQGDLRVSKVQGALHLSPGRSFLAQQQLRLSDLVEEQTFDISHTFHKLAFGKEFPGVINPLDSRDHLNPAQGQGLYQFHIKVVPTRFENLKGQTLDTNQYSVTEHFTTKTSGVGPGVYLQYDLSPVKVHITESLQHRSLLHFFTSLCAAVGGVFTVAGLVDSLLYHGHRRLSRKVD